LPVRYVDHALVGEWKDHRDCHIRPDLAPIYRKLENDVLELARIGSHSDLARLRGLGQFSTSMVKEINALT
jgi:mRNA interferase YafQ